jgi:protein SCO1/2
VKSGNPWHRPPAGGAGTKIPKGILFFFLILLAVPALVLPACRAEGSPPKYRRTVESFKVPDVVLVNQDGKKVRLRSLLETDKPVVVDFIYGTCTTICPVLSAGFASLQKRLGDDSSKVRLVSITIDPENDTPRVMKDYLERYHAKPGWEFLTGSRDDIDDVMEAFDAYFPNKMTHLPLNFIRSPADGKWIRLFGFMSSRDFLAECQKAGIE